MYRIHIIFKWNKSAISYLSYWKCFCFRDAEERYDRSQKQLDENKQSIKDLENHIEEFRSELSDERKKRKR